jgi:hypothetical protein
MEKHFDAIFLKGSVKLCPWQWLVSTLLFLLTLKNQASKKSKKIGEKSESKERKKGKIPSMLNLFHQYLRLNGHEQQQPTVEDGSEPEQIDRKVRSGATRAGLPGAGGSDSVLNSTPSASAPSTSRSGAPYIPLTAPSVTFEQAWEAAKPQRVPSTDLPSTLAEQHRGANAAPTPSSSRLQMAPVTMIEPTAAEEKCRTYMTSGELLEQHRRRSRSNSPNTRARNSPSRRSASEEHLPTHPHPSGSYGSIPPVRPLSAQSSSVESSVRDPSDDFFTGGDKAALAAEALLHKIDFVSTPIKRKPKGKSHSSAGSSPLKEEERRQQETTGASESDANATGGEVSAHSETEAAGPVKSKGVQIRSRIRELKRSSQAAGNLTASTSSSGPSKSHHSTSASDGVATTRPAGRAKSLTPAQKLADLLTPIVRGQRLRAKLKSNFSSTLIGQIKEAENLIRLAKEGQDIGLSTHSLRTQRRTWIEKLQAFCTDGGFAKIDYKKSAKPTRWSGRSEQPQPKGWGDADAGPGVAAAIHQDLNLEEGVSQSNQQSTTPKRAHQMLRRGEGLKRYQPAATGKSQDSKDHPIAATSAPLEEDAGFATAATGVKGRQSNERSPSATHRNEHNNHQEKKGATGIDSKTRSLLPPSASADGTREREGGATSKAPRGASASTGRNPGGKVPPKPHDTAEERGEAPQAGASTPKRTSSATGIRKQAKKGEATSSTSSANGAKPLSSIDPTRRGLQAQPLVSPSQQEERDENAPPTSTFRTKTALERHEFISQFAQDAQSTAQVRAASSLLTLYFDPSGGTGASPAQRRSGSGAAKSPSVSPSKDENQKKSSSMIPRLTREHQLFQKVTPDLALQRAERGNVSNSSGGGTRFVYNPSKHHLTMQILHQELYAAGQSS